MARPLRVHIPGALYHVISRGNARQPIFLTAEDYDDFLGRLASALARFDVRCNAYCLMENHFHLMLQPNGFPLSRMMQHLNSSYSQWFNRRHDRVGHVLQGRFKALLIDRDDYFRRVLRYIVLNPVRAGIAASPADWRWSSYRATAGLEAPGFLTVDTVWIAFDEEGSRAVDMYAAFVLDAVSEPEDRPVGPVAWGSDPFLADVGAALLAHRDTSELVYAERFACRPALDEVFAAADDPRTSDTAMRDAFYRHAYTLREIGDFVGRKAATVWQRIHRADDPSSGCGSTQQSKIEI